MQDDADSRFEIRFSRTHLSSSRNEKEFRVYVFECACPIAGCRTVLKRFRNFVAFDRHWKKLFPGVANSSLCRASPLPSRWQNASKEKVVQMRSVALLEYLRACQRSHQLIPLLRSFLGLETNALSHAKSSSPPLATNSAGVFIEGTTVSIVDPALQSLRHEGPRSAIAWREVFSFVLETTEITA